MRRNEKRGDKRGGKGEETEKGKGKGRKIKGGEATITNQSLGR